MSIVAVLFGFCAVVNAQEAEKKLAAADQYQIIGLLLNDKFKSSPEKTIYLTTANLHEEIQKNFPQLKNKTIRLISPEAAADSEVCAYEFGEFQVIEKFVSVSFGSCREGLAYDFVKDADSWKSVSSTVTRQMFY
jgi:hypothetical protein